MTILRLWWEAGFEPRRADGFVPAMRAALADYLAFAEARTLTWSDQAGRWGRLLSPPRRRRERGARQLSRARVRSLASGLHQLAEPSSALGSAVPAA